MAIRNETGAGERQREGRGDKYQSACVFMHRHQTLFRKRQTLKAAMRRASVCLCCPIHTFSFSSFWISSISACLLMLHKIMATNHVAETEHPPNKPTKTKAPRRSMASHGVSKDLCAQHWWIPKGSHHREYMVYSACQVH